MTMFFRIKAFLFSIMVVLTSLSISSLLYGFDFDKMFENINWDEVAQNLERTMQELESEQGGGLFGPSQPHQATPATQKKKPAEPPKKHVTVPVKDLFLKPQFDEKKGLIDLEKHQQAYTSTMDRLASLLSRVEREIDASAVFDIVFKEKFHQYKISISSILIADDSIRYDETATLLPLFFQNDQVRTLIVSAIEQLEKIIQRIEDLRAQHAQQTLPQQIHDASSATTAQPSQILEEPESVSREAIQKLADAPTGKKVITPTAKELPTQSKKRGPSTPSAKSSTATPVPSAVKPSATDTEAPTPVKPIVLPRLPL